MKDPLPDSEDSFSNFSIVLLSIPLFYYYYLFIIIIIIDTSALVDQVTSGGGLARVDVSDDDNVDVSLFLTHGDELEVYDKILKEYK